MPESRDRLSRSYNGVAYAIEMGIDLTPFRWGSTPLTGGGSGQHSGETLVTRTAIRGGVSGRALFDTPMRVYRRGRLSENTPPFSNSFRRGGRGGRTGPRSVLPGWYPRTPLGDITRVVRAMERRRSRLGDGAGHVLGSPIPILMDHQPADQDHSPSDAQLEHDVSFVTPKHKFGSKMVKESALGRVPLILTAVANKCEGELELETPQKKLLNSIEMVEKVVMEELHRLKRTPSAKRAEREKRVRTLMSMR